MSIMADVILCLVDLPAFESLLRMTIGDIASGMEDQSLRSIRPEADPKFHRDFEVDLEGDFLELVDNSDHVSLAETPSVQHSQSVCEFGIILARWCSIAQWRCWDARLFLYVEPILGRTISSDDEFVRPRVWGEFTEALSKTDRAAYSESVILDWMNRRESLGETMDPSKDSRILPTMESHRSLSKSLYCLLEQSRKLGCPLLIGREYLEPDEWNLGGTTMPEAMGAVL